MVRFIIIAVCWSSSCSRFRIQLFQSIIYIIYTCRIAVDGISINWKCVELLQLIWRSVARIYHIGLPDFVVNYSGLSMQREYHLNSPSDDHQMTCHFLVDRIQVYSFMKYPGVVSESFALYPTRGQNNMADTLSTFSNAFFRLKIPSNR